MANSDVSFHCQSHRTVDGTNESNVYDGKQIRQEVEFHFYDVVLDKHWQGKQEQRTEDVGLKGMLSSIKECP